MITKEEIAHVRELAVKALDLDTRVLNMCDAYDELRTDYLRFVKDGEQVGAVMAEGVVKGDYYTINTEKLDEVIRLCANVVGAKAVIKVCVNTYWDESALHQAWLDIQDAPEIAAWVKDAVREGEF